MYISDSIKYIGVNDYKIDLFEGQYLVPNGMHRLRLLPARMPRGPAHSQIPGPL